jgi:hypothetical protein
MKNKAFCKEITQTKGTLIGLLFRKDKNYDFLSKKITLPNPVRLFLNKCVKAYFLAKSCCKSAICSIAFSRLESSFCHSTIKIVMIVKDKKA